MKTSSIARGLILMALFGLAHTANAQTAFYPTDVTINDAVDGDNAIVGYANQSDYLNQINGTSPTVNFVTGGDFFGPFTILNSSTFNLTGGVIGDSLLAYDSSTANVRGGSIAGAYFVGQNGAINFFGTGLDALLIDPDSRGNSRYTLSGTLADGTPLSNDIFVANNSNARFNFNPGTAVPEPGTVALLVGMSVAGISIRGKRTRR